MPHPTPRRAVVAPPAPTSPSPAPTSPPRPAPVATLATVDARLPVATGGVCTCLLRLSNFCQEVRDLAGEEGITPKLLFSRTKKEVERGVTATGRGWSTRQTWRVREGALSCSKEVASGGLASSVNATSDPWLDIQAKSVSLVQVENSYFNNSNSMIDDTVAQVERLYNSSNEVA